MCVHTSARIGTGWLYEARQRGEVLIVYGTSSAYELRAVWEWPSTVPASGRRSFPPDVREALSPPRSWTGSTEQLYSVCFPAMFERLAVPEHIRSAGEVLDSANQFAAIALIERVAWKPKVKWTIYEHLRAAASASAAAMSCVARPVIVARDRWLTSGGTMIPGSVTA